MADRERVFFIYSHSAFSERLRSNVLAKKLLKRDLEIVLPAAFGYLCPKNPVKGKSSNHSRNY